MTGERTAQPAEDPGTLDELFGTPAAEPAAGAEESAPS